jgi:hypothetical protein
METGSDGSVSELSFRLHISMQGDVCSRARTGIGCDPDANIVRFVCRWQATQYQRQLVRPKKASSYQSIHSSCFAKVWSSRLHMSMQGDVCSRVTGTGGDPDANIVRFAWCCTCRQHSIKDSLWGPRRRARIGAFTRNDWPKCMCVLQFDMFLGDHLPGGQYLYMHRYVA